MTKSIRAVKQNLENLKTQVAESATELEALHRGYLEILSQSLKQQFILACYQICTELYPQSFINLSLSAKQDLQQNLRQLSSELQPQLIELLNNKELEPQPVELDLMAALLEKLPKPKRQTPEQGDLSAADLEMVKAEIASLENIENLEDIELIAIDTSSDSEEEHEESIEEAREEPPKEQIDSENPEHLILWHKQIERGIKKTLDNTSRQVNKLLQQSTIIPERLPNKVIDVAMQADGVKGMRSNSQQPKLPHIMHLAIESEQGKKSKSSKSSTQISLLRLRLAEVEFSDSFLNAKRSQIRSSISKIKQLDGQYKRIQKELATIEAQGRMAIELV